MAAHSGHFLACKFAANTLLLIALSAASISSLRRRSARLLVFVHSLCQDSYSERPAYIL